MRTKEIRRSKDTRKRTKKCMRTRVFRTLGGKLPSDGGGVPSALHTTTPRFIGTTFNFYCTFTKGALAECVTWRRAFSTFVSVHLVSIYKCL